MLAKEADYRMLRGCMASSLKELSDVPNWLDEDEQADGYDPTTRTRTRTRTTMMMKQAEDDPPFKRRCNPCPPAGLPHLRGGKSELLLFLRLFKT